MNMRNVFQINVNLIVYKLFFLFGLAAMSIIPFMSLYFKHRGMSPVRIGLLSAARPAFLSLSTPVVGYLTDKYQCPKITVAVGGCLWIGSTIVMGFALPKLEERPCKLIQKQWKRSEMSCIVENGKWLFPEVRHNTSTVLQAARYFEDRNTSQSNFSCNKFYNTLEADRSWLYSPDSLQVVFFILLLTNCLTSAAFSPLHNIADAESINTLQDMGMDIAEYGKQRGFGSMGWALGPVMFGTWISFTRGSASKCGIRLTNVDYQPMFIVFLVMASGAICTTLGFSYKQDYRSKFGLDSSIIRKLCSLPNLAVLFVVFYIGVCNGLLHGYLFWHLESIGGNELIMGLAMAAQGVSGFVLSLGTGTAIRKFGHLPLISVGVIVYLMRFVYYAYVKHPWWILGSEILHSLTFLLTWNTSLSYLSLVVPKDYRTSLSSVLNSLYDGFGNGCGYLIGGYLIQSFGSVNTFKCFGLMNACTAVIVIAIFSTNTSCCKIRETIEKDEEERCILLSTNAPKLEEYTEIHVQPK